MKVWKTTVKTASVSIALTLAACSSNGRVPATASKPQATAPKPIMAVAQEPAEPVEIQIEPIVETQKPITQDLTAKPQWWLAQPTLTEQEFIVTTHADAVDLRQARAAAVNQALALVKETFGHEPTDYDLTARAQTLADGGYRVFVRITAPRPAELGETDG